MKSRFTPSGLHSVGRWLYRLCIVGLLVECAIGVVWAALNFTDVPQYGDTTEYLRLAQTLKIDEYRGVLYPLILWALSVPSRGPLGLYALQLIVSAVALWYFTGSLFDAAGLRNEKDRLALAIPTLAAFFAPLSIHLSLSVMADSLAASLLLLTVGAFVTLMSAQKIRDTAVAGFIFAVATFLVTSIRAEMRLSIVGLVVLGVFRWFLSQQRLRGRIVSAGVMLAASSLGLIASIGVHTLLANDHQTRPPYKIATFMSTSIVWGRLARIHDRLPEELRSVVSSEEMRQADEDSNRLAYYLLPLLRERLGSWDAAEAALWTMARQALRDEWPAILKENARELVAYSVPFVYWHADLLGRKGGGRWSEWVYTRMANGRGNLTKAYTNWFIVLVVAVLLAIAVNAYRFRPHVSRDVVWVAAILVYVVVLRSVMFTLAGPEFNVRYALPQYEIGIAVLWIMLILTRRPPPAAQGTDRGADGDVLNQRGHAALLRGTPKWLNLWRDWITPERSSQSKAA